MFTCIGCNHIKLNRSLNKSKECKPSSVNFKGVEYKCQVQTPRVASKRILHITHLHNICILRSRYSCISMCSAIIAVAVSHYLHTH